MVYEDVSLGTLSSDLQESTHVSQDWIMDPSRPLYHIRCDCPTYSPRMSADQTVSYLGIDNTLNRSLPSLATGCGTTTPLEVS